ncbi:MAG: peptidoglycan-binding protein [Oscillatoriales cyanobacterium RM2_1_1]|nr:peptidoglycan-binding protein [Oscillatoriales cyanobacterium SM2_3_0]NJO45487.1 peptidoglycan-binding protein [Oscillatoriales cyanobacterium RM2_1_1]
MRLQLSIRVWGLGILSSLGLSILVLAPAIALRDSVVLLAPQARGFQTSVDLAQGINELSTSQLQRPVLQSGSQGPEVIELQAALQLLGYYPGEVDGIYGEATAQAVTQFQSASNLTPNGVMNQPSWDRLFPPGKSSPISPSPEEITEKIPETAAAGTSTGISTQSVGLPVLKLGMGGEAVTGLQERLKAKGFLSGEIDGVFGPATLEAVQAAQRQFELEPDGVVGSATWMILLRP